MSLKRLRIVHLITLLSLVWFLLLLGIVTRCGFTMRNIVDETNLILSRNLPLFQAIADIESDLFIQLRMIHSESINQDKFNQLSNSILKKVSQLSNGLKQISTTFEDKKLIKELLLLLDNFHFSFNYIKNIKLMEINKNKNEIDHYLNKLSIITKKLKKDMDIFNIESRKYIHNEIISIKRHLTFGIVISLVIGILFSLFIISNISSKLKKIKYRLEDIATGDADLTKRLVIEGNTEVDEIARLLNTFIERIQALIADIKEKGKKLTQQVHELTALAESLASTAVEGQAQAEEVEGTARNTGDQMQSIAAAMEEMTTTVSEISQHTTSTSNIASNAVDKMNVAQEIVKRLGDASSSIEAMSTLIGAIAEQTNLLALNATIEAARAGEAGKGFAVVANEVKDLAKQTGEAVQEIESNIRVLQEHVESVVDFTSEISGVIAKVNELASSVAVAVEEQTATTNEISHNTHEATSNVTTLVEMSSAIKDASSQTAAGSEQAKASARELREITLALKSALDAFTT